MYRGPMFQRAVITPPHEPSRLGAKEVWPSVSRSDMDIRNEHFVDIVDGFDYLGGEFYHRDTPVENPLVELV